MNLNAQQKTLNGMLKNALLLSGTSVTLESLLDSASTMSTLVPGLSQVEISEVVSSLTAEFLIVMSEGGSVVDPATFTRWLADRKETTDLARWDAYRELLSDRGFATPVLKDMEKQTDEIVELLGDPLSEGPWERRGLLMGEVQSGKTATYTGVINKAIDYGYRLIIVIGGHTEDLRRQTQTRLDSDVLGFDSSYVQDNIAESAWQRVGIGLINHSIRTNPDTTALQDFSSGSARGPMSWMTGEVPNLFVIKKNARIIENVAFYLKKQAVATQGRFDLPMLLIDDESDWGTPNTGSETDPTRVNSAIRQLLARSSRSSYLGVTATPFANIFIDHQAEDESGLADLFPSDYIRVMPKPSNYRGMLEYFGTEESASVSTEVDDCVALLPIKHKKTHVVEHLPQSMKNAIAEFLVGTAIRRLREGERVAASMLVNVSRFNHVQKQVASLVDDCLEQFTSAVKNELFRYSEATSGFREALERAWHEFFEGRSAFPWEQVRSELVNVVDELRPVELVNSVTASKRVKSRSLMNEEMRRNEDLRPVVYVGGNVLSRGLTLDGLQVSYFVREPRSMDALLQTGRWFGYRPGYEDLVRIWLPSTTLEDLKWSAETTDELRQLLLEMDARRLTPRDFGLRVRTHPEGFNIVAANKAKSTAVHEGAILWEDTLVESYLLPFDVDARLANYEAVKTLISHAIQHGGQAESSHGRYPSWRHLPQALVREFLEAFQGAPEEPTWTGSSDGTLPFTSDIVREAKNSKFWDVALVNGASEERLYFEGGIELRGSVRNPMKVDPRDKRRIEVGRRRVASQGSLHQAMTSDEWNRARVKFESYDGASFKWPSEKLALAELERPILLVFSLTKEEENEVKVATERLNSATTPIIGLALALPKMDLDEGMRRAQSAKRYRVNTVWLGNMLGVDDEDEGDADD